jgi:hypothetical protein
MLKKILAAAAVAACAPGAAATLDVSAATAGDSEIRAAWEVGRCIAGDRDAAAAVVGLLPLSGDGMSASAAARIAATGCARGEVRALSPVLVRGAIAQQLYFTDFREFGTEPRNRGRWIDLALPVESEGEPAGDATAQLYRWADCVVRNDTAATEKLMRAPLGSRQEAQILQSMQPYMSACLDPDARLAVAPVELRSLFAQSAYHNLYRYWSGELRQTGLELGRLYAAGGSGDMAAVVCKRFSVAGSRVTTRRFCLTEAEWGKVHWRNREYLYHMTSTGLQSG